MAATQIVASMAPFDLENDDFTEYSERFEMFLTANTITEPNLKRAVFLSTMGGASYKLLRSLVGEEIKSKTFAELVKAMKDHLKPVPNEIAERFHFFKRDRKRGETVSDYITELRRLSEHCAFGDQLNVYLRDRLVCGLNSESIQQKLLSIKDLDLSKALNTARSYESASRDARLIHSGGEVSGSSAGVHQTSRWMQEEANAGECIHKIQGKAMGSDTRECYRCGNQGHLANVCPFATYSCRRCGKVGHLQKKCRSTEKKKDSNAQVKPAAAIRNVCACQCKDGGEGSGAERGEQTWDPLNLFLLEKQSAVEPIMVEVVMNGKPVRMEVDTGAAVTVMNSSSYGRVKTPGAVELQRSDMKLKTYTGEVISPEGVGQVDVKYQDQQLALPITVVQGNVPNLMGRDWLGVLKLKWDELFPLEHKLHKLEGVDGPVSKLVNQFPEVFTNDLGCLNNFKLNIPVPEDAAPKFCKARPVPYALRSRLEEELDRLEEQGVWSRVQYSKWAAPLVAVLKDPRDPSGPIRVCGDYKQTVNRAAPVDAYPIPNTVDQLATLAGGEKFTKLDLSQAYQQLELDDGSKELLTINTHQGLYQPARMQFGIHSATGIFQREMDQRLSRIPMTKVRVDDILISGKNDKDHLENLKCVLEKLREAGLTVKVSKCFFMQDEVTYCGYVISKKGIKPMPSNVEAVREAPSPTNLKELRSFLGMVNYYNMYLEGLATVTESLHKLMRKEVVWTWTKECQSAFTKVKEMLCSAPLLAHFDMSKPIIVHCDASEYGVGVVLSHILDGVESPVCYASRTLSMAERNYATVEKEGLALVFAVKKFHQFLFGNKFLMYTDHKPLMGLFSETCPLPARAAARVLRWAILLSAYNYELRYREGVKNGNADGLSRLPLDARNGDASQKVVSIAMVELVKAPVTDTELRQHTRNDPVLGVVLQRVLDGSLEREEGELFKPYKTRASELTTESGCLLWGSRVIIPKGLQNKVLLELHEVHPGMTRMKALARSYVWWPGIDSDIETTVRKCLTCQMNQNKPSAAPVHAWEFPSTPWERLHIDHAGPTNGDTFLVVVDSFSKWVEVERVKSMDAKTTCAVLRKMFATHGLPRVVVSDNGPGFQSEEFNTFLKSNGVRHIYSAPYHPSSNGQAERFVRTFKESLKVLKEGDVDMKLSRFLLRYRITPQTTTGQSPSELLLRRRIRSSLSLMKPDLAAVVRRKQEPEVERPGRYVDVGTDVLALNFSAGDKWLPGVVVEVRGASNYMVQLRDGRIVHRHIDQIVRHHQDGVSTPSSGLDDVVHVPEISLQLPQSCVQPAPVLPDRETVPEPSNSCTEYSEAAAQSHASSSSVVVPSSSSTVERTETDTTTMSAVPTRKSVRFRRKPEYLRDYEV